MHSAALLFPPPSPSSVCLPVSLSPCPPFTPSPAVGQRACRPGCCEPLVSMIHDLCHHSRSLLLPRNIWSAPQFSPHSLPRHHALCLAFVLPEQIRDSRSDGIHIASCLTDRTLTSRLTKQHVVLGDGAALPYAMVRSPSRVATSLPPPFPFVCSLHLCAPRHKDAAIASPLSSSSVPLSAPSQSLSRPPARHSLPPSLLTSLRASLRSSHPLCLPTHDDLT